jgi:hypothetical protein
MKLKPRESEFAVAIFNDSRAVLDPVAGVAVRNAFDLNVLWGMDVAADDSVNSSMTSMTDDLISKTTDVFSYGP